MSKMIIFGAGSSGKAFAKSVSNNDEIICFIDSDPNKWETQIDGIPVYSLLEIKKLDFDCVILASGAGIDEMEHQLLEIGVPQIKIRKVEELLIATRAREFFLARYAEMVYDNHLEGSVAEVGVFRGEFARHINMNFKDRCCYLFDTFSGFDARDIELENKSITEKEEHLAGTSVQLVMSKMQNPETVIIKEGWFPESAKDVDDNFIFVNLDLDLYSPTFEGLKLFYPLMNEGGGVF